MFKMYTHSYYSWTGVYGIICIRLLVICINPFLPCDAIRRYRSMSKLDQAMACCLWTFCRFGAAVIQHKTLDIVVTKVVRKHALLHGHNDIPLMLLLCCMHYRVILKGLILILCRVRYFLSVSIMTAIQCRQIMWYCLTNLDLLCAC